MNKRRSRFMPGDFSVDHSLEQRLVLSGGSAHAVAQGTVEVAALRARNAATSTTLTVTAGTLGQPITFSATVRASASAGSPVGSVNILDRGQVIETIPLSPTASTNARFAFSQGTVTLTQPPGGNAYYFGNHRISAVFVPGGGFSKSVSNKSFTVGQPSYTALASGVKIATIAPGSGPAILAGQTANMLYTGYLVKNGKIFDDSQSHGGAPFSFTLGAGQVVPGFDQGTAGMQAGETRILFIPPAQGYGSTPNGSIPANSTLIFVVTLTSIS